MEERAEMKTRIRSIVGIAALIFTAACSGTMAQLEQSPPTSQPAGHAPLPLLYVVDSGIESVDVFTLPQARLTRVLTGFAAVAGVCSGADGDVFVVDLLAGAIRVYPHGGGTPIRLLGDPGYYPYACAVDPLTGDLAVTNSGPRRDDGVGNIAFYRHGKAPRRLIGGPNLTEPLACSYDGRGNLFIAEPGGVSIAELPAGHKTFASIRLHPGALNPTDLQWDGKYLAISELHSGVIYRYAIDGLIGRRVGKTVLAGSSGVSVFWIDGSTIYVPEVNQSARQEEVRLYGYPAGGRAHKRIDGFSTPSSLTVSRVRSSLTVRNASRL